MCILCQIIKGELPSYKVYEDEKTLAILDINPNNAGHTLVFPKKHYANLEEISDIELGAVISTVKKVGSLLKDKLGAPGYNVTENNDPVSGQMIPHLHFHVIPRYEGDGLRLWVGHEYGEGEAEAVLNKLRA